MCFVSPGGSVKEQIGNLTESSQLWQYQKQANDNAHCNDPMIIDNFGCFYDKKSELSISGWSPLSNGNCL